MIAVLKNIRMFAVFLTKEHTFLRYGDFYILLTATICKDIRLFKSHVSRCVLNVMVPWSEMRGEQPFLFINNPNFVDTMTKGNEICSRAKHSTPSATADARQASESTSNKLAIVESCIIDLVRMKSLMYNHDLINPFPDQYPTAIDPFDLLDDVIRFINDFSILHAELGKEVAHV